MTGAHLARLFVLRAATFAGGALVGMGVLLLAQSKNRAPATWFDEPRSHGGLLILAGVLLGYLVPFAIRTWWWMRHRAQDKRAK